MCTVHTLCDDSHNNANTSQGWHLPTENIQEISPVSSLDACSLMHRILFFTYFSAKSSEKAHYTVKKLPQHV